MESTRAEAGKAIEQKFDALMKKAEGDFNAALQKYEINLKVIEQQRREVGNKQTEHNIEYAKHILENDIAKIKDSIKKSLQKY